MAEQQKPGQAGKPDVKRGGKFEPPYKGTTPGKRESQQPPKKQ